MQPTCVIVPRVCSTLFDVIIDQFAPHKIVVFVDCEEEDEQRTEYERVYWRYGDRITLYAGDVPLLIAAYRADHPDHRLFTVHLEEMLPEEIGSDRREEECDADRREEPVSDRREDADRRADRC